MFTEDSACSFKIVYEVDEDGLSNVSVVDPISVTPTVPGNPDAQAPSEKQAKKDAAREEAYADENIYRGVTSTIRMTFSFILLFFYIASITIIGFVFATLIPGIFRKIMLIFSRATRLR
jgi:hypothetical protein